jgi:hypothetical protein
LDESKTGFYLEDVLKVKKDRLKENSQGVAFAHKDGNGLNVELRAIPVSGKLVIRRHEPKAKASES